MAYAFSVVRLVQVGGNRLRGTSGGLARDDPPLGFSSSHDPDTSCLRSPCLLELVANPRAGLLPESSS